MDVTQPTSSMTSEQPATSSTQSQRPTPTTAEEPPLQALENFCNKKIREVAARLLKGSVSHAGSDHVGRSAESAIMGGISTVSEASVSQGGGSGEILISSESSTDHQQQGAEEDLSQLIDNPLFPAFCQLIESLRRFIENPGQLDTLMQTLQRVPANMYFELIEQRLQESDQGGDDD